MADRATIALASPNCNPYSEAAHFIICHCAVWQVHVDIPRRIRHHHVNIRLEDGEIKRPANKP